MSIRLGSLVPFLILEGSMHAQVESVPKFVFHATVYCQHTQVPLQGVLLNVIDNSGRSDSLLTDSLGVARTSSGSDSLSLSAGRNFSIELSWPPGSVQLPDRIVTDTLRESTVFVKEYFLRTCNDPSTDHRWLPPSVYFPTNSAIPRNDSAWYQQEAQVNSVEEAVAAVADVMRENPTIILQTIGYCDAREKDPERLSLARANYVRNLLVEKGIPTERVQAEGRPEDHRYSTAEIAHIMDHQERENALARDRQVGYLVVSFDYKP